MSVERLLADLEGLRLATQMGCQPQSSLGLGSLGFKTAEEIRERIAQLHARFVALGVEVGDLIPSSER